MFLEDTFARGASKLLAFGEPGNRLFWLYLLSSLLLAILAYFLFRGKTDPDDRPDGIDAGMFHYIFDPKVFFHKSAIQDYFYFVINAFIYYGLISQVLISQQFIYKIIMFTLVKIFGAPETAFFAVTPLTVAFYTIFVVLVFDFAGFLAHFLMHRVPVLWQFHQVHHSAEVLTPITVARLHPVDMFITGLTLTIFGTFAIAIFAYLTGDIISPYRIMGVNVIVFAIFLIGYNLRHSHVWLNFPRWIAWLLISPAQHQIHHSVEVRHFDKNYGFAFSFWDRLFGSLYYPRRFEKLTFGINKKEPNPFPTVLSLYVKPFRNAWAIIVPRDGRVLRRIGVAAWLALAVAFYLGVYTVSTAERGYVPPSVYLEELTWTEVRRALDEGYTRIIVPTGGVEQNGPHMILGKHNYVVRETAGRIATELGDALVAPVIGFVPEGATGPEPTSHMRFPGTLTVPNDVFEALMIWSIESYATHGFKTMYLIGDSGPNQPPQARIAERYANDSRGLAVYHIGDYYAAHGQIDWLLLQGFTQEQIGSHAGIRDTSELMVANPNGVRQDVVVLPSAEGLGLGSNGAPDQASTEIGEEMLNLKVQAALRQIRDLDQSTALTDALRIE
ncbi:MAG TPA: creatininase family protein [Thermohalobaculum sp.]|nr:creatininase family protein [Thermohalobaculum sp.]